MHLDVHVTRCQYNNLLKPDRCFTGIFGVPRELCAVQYAESILRSNPKTLQEIHFVDCKSQVVKLIQHVFNVMITNKHAAPYNTSDYISSKQSRKKSTQIDTSTTTNEQAQTVSDEPIPKYTYRPDCLKLSYASNVNVCIYKQDIWDLQNIQGIVCPVFADTDSGAIASHLKDNGGISYRKEKKKFLKELSADVFQTTGGLSNFKEVVHAFVPRQPDELMSVFGQLFKLCDYLNRYNT